MGRFARLGLPLALIASALVGCRPERGGPLDPTQTDGGTGPRFDDTLSGAAAFASICAGCHGSLGQGGVGARLDAWRPSEGRLVDIIDERMPPDDPTRCQGVCAARVARYILDELQLSERPASCSESEPARSERQLRLLSRIEYENTLADLQAELLTVPEPGPEAACRTVTFSFDPGARALDSVVVAGSFNQWAGTVADGGWALEYDPGSSRWVGHRAIEDGRHTYKFVLDGTEWVTDPANPLREDDGFGGSNSVLVQSCGAGGGASSGPSLDFAALSGALPPESRPPGYLFDNAAEAGLVTAVHVEAYLAIAARVAEAASAEASTILACGAGESPAGCAERFVRRFGRRAFRRPLDEEEVARYVGLMLAEADLRRGLEVALSVFLSSGHFLYRSELGEPMDGAYHLTNYEIASALSYLFWRSMPDEVLLTEAELGRLRSAEGRAAAAARLLESPRSRAPLESFASQWLGVEPILTTTKHQPSFPELDDALRAEMLDETRRFFAHVVFSGSGRYEELLTANYSFVTPRLAALYGETASGADQPTTFSRGQRSGLLGHGSMLGVYAYSAESSPVRRGLFVRQRLLCQEFGTPPPNAGGIPPVDPNATTRERFSQHSANPSCFACHQYIDDVGFGFERFDAVGRYRETDNGRPVDARGNMNDVEGFGTKTNAPFETLPELARTLADSRAAKACFARQFHQFASGRKEAPEDRCVVSAFEQSFEASGGDIKALMIDFVRSDAFVWKR